MPHYKNGQPAKLNDLIVHEDQYSKAAILGILVAIQLGADTCNGSVVPVARKWAGTGWLPFPLANPLFVTLKNALPVERALPEELTEAAPQGDGDPRAASAT